MGAGAAECIGRCSERDGGGGTRDSSGGGGGGGLRSESFGHWVVSFAVEEFGDCYLYLGVGKCFSEDMYLGGRIKLGPNLDIPLGAS